MPPRKSPLLENLGYVTNYYLIPALIGTTGAAYVAKYHGGKRFRLSQLVGFVLAPIFTWIPSYFYVSERARGAKTKENLPAEMLTLAIGTSLLATYTAHKQLKPLGEMLFGSLLLGPAVAVFTPPIELVTEDHARTAKKGASSSPASAPRKLSQIKRNGEEEG